MANNPGNCIAAAAIEVIAIYAKTLEPLCNFDLINKIKLLASIFMLICSNMCSRC